ncbi:BatA domain-containing protein [Neolewinella lacunae]|uniref:BatA domain-containing protein n=1 Tax=Neolewinella lacunae TaxID=1517758 RepID=A0A923PGU3_9BACT|nr:BatA domain-containing protein [Neolewinella lacunae]MBC6993863.1 BatA domain-containing protein [Neolewinella lacunae]MDN3637076.1 BatA domain-containing protein [Neolewinella lacunae]
MQFLYPSFLWALAALAIPIIIHLFYFRRFKKVAFSNVKFLKEVKEETSMRSRLRNLLVLLARCLALAALVFAFAQPFLPTAQEIMTGQKAVSLYIDNSFSMGAESDSAPLLQIAKDRAQDIVKAYGVEDRFQVLDNDFNGRNQRLVGQEEALELIDAVRSSPATRRLSVVEGRQRSALRTENIDNRIAYLISDFQRNSADLEINDVDTSVRVNLVPLTAVRERNVGIDSVWFAAPVAQLNQNNLLLVRVRNYGSEDLDNVRLSLTYDGQNKPEGTLAIPAQEFVVDSVYLNITTPGVGQAELRITDFPVQFDDVYYITFRTADRVKALNIDDNATPNRNLRAALGGLSVFDPTYVGSRNIDYGSLGDYNLVILTGQNSVASGLAEQLRQYVENGGNLLIFPPAAADVSSYNAFLRRLGADELGAYDETPREVSQLNSQEFIFRDVFRNRDASLRLPETQGNFPLGRVGSRRQEVLLGYRDGSTALAKYPLGEGNLYLSSAPLASEVNTLALNAEVFIPMLYKMGISSGRRRPSSYTIGQDEVIQTNKLGATAELVFKLRGPGGEFIPEQRTVDNRVLLGLGGQVPTAGVYELVLGETVVDAFAFNYDRRESDLSYLSPEDLANLAANPGIDLLDAANQASLIGDIQERNEGTPLWRYFIWAALLFLLAEVLLLRFWKV